MAILSKKSLYPLVLALFLVSFAFAEEVFYVQSAKAKVFSEASFNSGVLVELSRGSKVAVIGKDSNWNKVIINGKTGYISAFLLGKNPPIEKVSPSKEKLTTEGENPRSRVSHTTAVAGVRGLSQERRARLGKEEKVNYEALEKMESVKISDEELKVFIKEGNL